MPHANVCALVKTWLLVFTVLCLHITQPRSQLMQFNSATNPTTKSRVEISCAVVDSKKNDGVDLFNYDCSSKHLGWPDLDSLIDHIRSSSNLNLADNRFDPENHTIYNTSFTLFQLLENTLNLSSNQFERAESHAFFYRQYTDETVSLVAHRFRHLDLSNNSFASLPWRSMQYLPELATLYLSGNPLKRLDVGDLGLSSRSGKWPYRPFSALTKLYLSKCQIETVEPNVFAMFATLQFVDLSHNRLKHLSHKIIMSNSLLSYVNLVGNPLECDCHLLWLKDFIVENEHVYKAYDRLQVNR